MQCSMRVDKLILFLCILNFVSFLIVIAIGYGIARTVGG